MNTRPISPSDRDWLAIQRFNQAYERNTMNAAEQCLHHLRGQQLKALAQVRNTLEPEDSRTVQRYFELAGSNCDTRGLSAKSLEEIDALCSKYFDQVRSYGS